MSKYDYISNADAIWKMRENGKAYQDTSGLTKRIAKNVKMYEGEQWEPPTKETIGMPRPVIDITSFTVNNKLSKVAGVPVDLVYSAVGENEDDRLGHFWSWWRKKEKFDKKFRKAIRKSAVHCGALLF